MRTASLLIAHVAGLVSGRLILHPTEPIAGRRAAAMAGGPGFVGSWRMTVFEAEGPPTLALATLGADGTAVIAEHPVVTPPFAPGVVFTSGGHGAWMASGPTTANLTYVGLGSYGEGVLFGTATARSSITLSADGQTFGGEVVWDLADPKGYPLASYQGRFQATRIVAEAPVR
ncbi:MAG TPA: hypothetical protein VH482_16040 [Thermomicrobiales bacterium]|jgi:hypothetical protein